MNTTTKRIVSTLIGLAILALGYVAMQYLVNQKEAPPKREVAKRIKSVKTVRVYNEAIQTELDVQGQLQAYNKISLFSEVGGTVQETGSPFKEGVYFKKGAVMLRIDDAEARLNLQAQKATLMNAIATMMPDMKIDYPDNFPAWESYLAEFSVDDAIKTLPESSSQREKLFVAGRNLYTQFYNIKSSEERLSKYVLYAPFSGVLTSTAINKGALVRAGQQLGELMATNYFELVATVPLSRLDFLKPGGTVQLFSEDTDGRWTGKVKRISDQIDPGSQTVDVFIGVSGPNLREGMYLRGAAEATTIEQAVEIDRDLLVDDREVFAVANDTLLRLMPVTIEKYNRETVIVSGLPDGTELLTSTLAGAYDGMRVNRQTDAKADAAATTNASPASPTK